MRTNAVPCARMQPRTGQRRAHSDLDLVEALRVFFPFLFILHPGLIGSIIAGIDAMIMMIIFASVDATVVDPCPCSAAPLRPPEPYLYKSPLVRTLYRDYLRHYQDPQ